MAIRNDQQAQAAINNILAKPVDNPGPTWLEVVDLCLYAKKRLVSPDTRAKSAVHGSRTEYWRRYKRQYRAKLRGQQK